MGHKVAQDSALKIPGISLTTLLAEVGKPVTLMKIDIEGAEEAFLCGHADLLKNKVRSLVIELHPRSCDAAAVRKTLEQAYTSITEVSDTQTDKPLLWCFND